MRPEGEEKRHGLVSGSLHCVAIWMGSLYMFGYLLYISLLFEIF